MAGHSHWAGIKHKKGVVDKKRGKEFAKLLRAISAAAKTETNPDFNPRLRTAVAKAREASVPNDKIESAIKRAGTEEKLEEFLGEAYGPGGAAILIEALTDSTNRTAAEIKKILNETEGKWAEPGSVRWAFEEIQTQDGLGWKAKFPMSVGEEDKSKLRALLDALQTHEDVQRVFTNASL